MTKASPESFLERIVAATREELAARQARVSLADLRAQVAGAPAPRDFASALRPDSTHPARLIAEVKRASPSKGLLAERFDPVGQAMAYAAGGAAAISVLTEPRYFLGSLEHLRAVRAAVTVPVLRKDFLLDPYQVYEARVAGADAALLILAMLDDALAADLFGEIRALGMEALVEAHNAAEVERAVRLGARVIGVNARDLRTFTVDTAAVRRMRSLVPPDRIFVAESGVTNWRDAARARAAGADAVLVGEALMRAADPAATARELSTAPGGAIAGLFVTTGQPFIKICGLATPEQAAAVARFGADAFGLVFAPMAPAHRRVTPEQAASLVRAVDEAELLGFPSPLPVGVFVNPTLGQVDAIAREVGLSVLQLSGDETPEQVERIRRTVGIRVIKTLRPQTEADLSLMDEYAQAGAALLIDAPARGANPVNGGYGGAGVTGDWSLAREAERRWPIILAGGLTPENVAEAVTTVAPRGVDVSSGVETDHAKDIEMIRQFIERARAAANQSAEPMPGDE